MGMDVAAGEHLAASAQSCRLTMPFPHHHSCCGQGDRTLPVMRKWSTQLVHCPPAAGSLPPSRSSVSHRARPERKRPGPEKEERRGEECTGENTVSGSVLRCFLLFCFIYAFCIPLR